MIDPMLQKKLTEMLRWFHSFCVDNGLRYYLLAGTMLGAARHQGFIPWDDDIDVGVPRSDYEKLIKLLQKPVDGYVVESPKYSEAKLTATYAKLYDTGTTLIENSRYKLKRGIYLDVFPLDGFGDDREESLEYFKKIKLLENVLATRVCAVRKGRKLIKNAAAVAGKLLPVNDQKLIRRIDEACAQRDFDKCQLVGNMMSVYRQKEMMPKSFYGAPTLYSFEGMQVYGVEDAESYLTHLYGDWRKLPPEEKRVSLHEHVYLNLNEPYMQ